MIRFALSLSAAVALAACSGSSTPEAKVVDAKKPVADPADHGKAAASQPAASQPAKKLGKGATPADRDQVDEDGIVRRGVKLASAKPLTIKECAAKSGELAGKDVTVVGTVEKVCVKKGCWFAVADEGETIRITMKDYGFFVPKNAVGKQATVVGQLEVKELTEAEAKHLAEDGGKDPATVTGPQKELRIISAGLELHPAKS